VYPKETWSSFRSLAITSAMLSLDPDMDRFIETKNFTLDFREALIAVEKAGRLISQRMIENSREISAFSDLIIELAEVVERSETRQEQQLEREREYRRMQGLAPPQLSDGPDIQEEQRQQMLLPFSYNLRILATNVAKMAERHKQNSDWQVEFLWETLGEYLSLTNGARDALTNRLTVLREYQKQLSVFAASQDKMRKIEQERNAKEAKKIGSSVADDKFITKFRQTEETYLHDRQLAEVRKFEFLNLSNFIMNEFVTFHTNISRDFSLTLTSYWENVININCEELDDMSEFVKTLKPALQARTSGNSHHHLQPRALQY
jgi:hypothetical protein